MTTGQFLIEQECRKYESFCTSAICRVQQAKTMWEVTRAAHVPVPVLLRGMHLDSRVGASSQLKRAAERRLAELLNDQLKEAAALADPEARKAFLGKLRHRDWSALRGEFASLYRKADMEGRRLLA